MVIYPPRPEKAIIPGLIPNFERQGYIAQIKFNGTCQVIAIDKFGVVDFRTRKGERNRAWAPSGKVIDFFQKFPDSIFVGELLHSKGPSVKDTIVLFDVIQYTGELLIGRSLSDRLDILKTIKETANVKVARVHKKNLLDLFRGLTDPLHEGIVLKKPDAVLRDCRRSGLNAGWQIKVRKPTKNYGY
jgi:ATP-dependent RNA circularization protein (DNA/RNA ligase family)